MQEELTGFWKTKGDIVVFIIGHFTATFIMVKIYKLFPRMFGSKSYKSVLTGIYWFYVFLCSFFTYMFITIVNKTGGKTVTFPTKDILWKFLVIHIASYILMCYIWFSNKSWVTQMYSDMDEDADDEDDYYGDEEDENVLKVMEEVKGTVNLMIHVMNAVVCGMYIILTGVTLDMVIEKLLPSMA